MTTAAYKVKIVVADNQDTYEKLSLLINVAT